jgi:hypothetical protein
MTHRTIKYLAMTPGCIWNDDDPVREAQCFYDTWAQTIKAWPHRRTMPNLAAAIAVTEGLPYPETEVRVFTISGMVRGPNSQKDRE